MCVYSFFSPLFYSVYFSPPLPSEFKMADSTTAAVHRLSTRYSTRSQVSSTSKMLLRNNKSRPTTRSSSQKQQQQHNNQNVNVKKTGIKRKRSSRYDSSESSDRLVTVVNFAWAFCHFWKRCQVPQGIVNAMSLYLNLPVLFNLCSNFQLFKISISKSQKLETGKELFNRIIFISLYMVLLC